MWNIQVSLWNTSLYAEHTTLDVESGEHSKRTRGRQGAWTDEESVQVVFVVFGFLLEGGGIDIALMLFFCAARLHVHQRLRVRFLLPQRLRPIPAPASCGQT